MGPQGRLLALSPFENGVAELGRVDLDEGQRLSLPAWNGESVVLEDSNITDDADGYSLRVVTFGTAELGPARGGLPGPVNGALVGSAEALAGSATGAVAFSLKIIFAGQ